MYIPSSSMVEMMTSSLKTPCFFLVDSFVAPSLTLRSRREAMSSSSACVIETLATAVGSPFEKPEEEDEEDDDDDDDDEEEEEDEDNDCPP